MSKETILVALAGLFLGALFTAGLWILRPPVLPGINPEIVKPAEVVMEKEIEATPSAKPATESAKISTSSAKPATGSAKIATSSGSKKP